MKTIFTATFILGLLLSSQNALSQEKCVSGKPQNTNLLDQLKSAQSKSEVTKIIYDQYQLNKTEGAAVCETCRASSSTEDQARKIQDSVEKIPKAPELVFKTECLKASNQFSASEPELACPAKETEKAKKIPHTKSSPQLCMNENFLKYENAVISNFVGCTMREGLKGIDASSLFKLYSVETGFKPQYFSRNGRGLGQLTGIFIDDIYQHDTLSKIAESTQPECAAAKLIAQKDRTKKPDKMNGCNFGSVGDGLERNILYSLIGLNTFYKRLEPTLASYLDKYSDDPKITEVRNLALLNAYGPKGPAGAKATIRRFSGLKPAQFIEQMSKPLKLKNNDNLTIYTSRIKAREEELQKKLPEQLQKDYKNKGAAACIN